MRVPAGRTGTAAAAAGRHGNTPRRHPPAPLRKSRGGRGSAHRVRCHNAPASSPGLQAAGCAAGSGWYGAHLLVALQSSSAAGQLTGVGRLQEELRKAALLLCHGAGCCHRWLGCGRRLMPARAGGSGSVGGGKWRQCCGSGGRSRHGTCSSWAVQECPVARAGCGERLPRSPTCQGHCGELLGATAVQTMTVKCSTLWPGLRSGMHVLPLRCRRRRPPRHHPEADCWVSLY